MVELGTFWKTPTHFLCRTHFPASINRYQYCIQESIQIIESVTRETKIKRGSLSGWRFPNLRDTSTRPVEILLAANLRAGYTSHRTKFGQANGFWGKVEFLMIGSRICHKIGSESKFFKWFVSQQTRQTCAYAFTLAHVMLKLSQILSWYSLLIWRMFHVLVVSPWCFSQLPDGFNMFLTGFVPPVICYITMQNHHVQWVNPLFPWPFSIATFDITRWYIIHIHRLSVYMYILYKNHILTIDKP